MPFIKLCLAEMFHCYFT